MSIFSIFTKTKKPETLELKDPVERLLVYGHLEDAFNLKAKEELIPPDQITAQIESSSLYREIYTLLNESSGNPEQLLNDQKMAIVAMIGSSIFRKEGKVERGLTRNFINCIKEGKNYNSFELTEMAHQRLLASFKNDTQHPELNTFIKNHHEEIRTQIHSTHYECV